MNHVLDTLILHAFENGSLTWYARYPLSPSLESKPSYSSAAAVVSLICVSHSLFSPLEHIDRNQRPPKWLTMHHNLIFMGLHFIISKCEYSF